MSRRNDERDLLVEAAMTAYRERDASGRIQASAAWCDLDEEGREALFEEQVAWRTVERLVNSNGQSGTGSEVVARARQIEQARRR